MDDQIEHSDVVTEEVVETEPESPASEPAKEEPKADKPKETLEQKRARLQRELERTEKKLGLAEEAPSQPSASNQDAILDFFELKGITESEDVELLTSIMEKTGMSHRDVLKDEYVVAKLAANKQAREVLEATPSATKRPGGQVDSVAQAIAKFESTGQMPEDFKLRSAVVDHLERKSRTNAPSWHS